MRKNKIDQIEEEETNSQPILVVNPFTKEVVNVFPIFQMLHKAFFDNIPSASININNTFHFIALNISPEVNNIEFQNALFHVSEMYTALNNMALYNRTN